MKTIRKKIEMNPRKNIEYVKRVQYQKHFCCDSNSNCVVAGNQSKSISNGSNEHYEQCIVNDHECERYF
jgi:hypothetical protein